MGTVDGNTPTIRPVVHCEVGVNSAPNVEHLHDDKQDETCARAIQMQKLIALLTHFDNRVPAAAWRDYFGSFGDDIFGDDSDDPVTTAADQRRTTAARARLVTERRTLNRSQHPLAPRHREQRRT